MWTMMESNFNIFLTYKLSGEGQHEITEQIMMKVPQSAFGGEEQGNCFCSLILAKVC